jgi:beta-phosphoglucomutase-like phosphatase (HAD superfamily)
MALDAMIFDIDGTLVDTNPAHVKAWYEAFVSCGYRVAPDRIAVEIGKGGDLLVSAVLGRQAPRIIGGVLDGESRALLQESLRKADDPKRAAYLKELVAVKETFAR